MSSNPFKKPKPKKERNIMHQTKGVTKDVFNILAAAINYFRPKTDDDYFASADARKEFKKLLKDGGKEVGPDGREIVLIAEGESVTMSFEDASFRFLEKAFKTARESGEVYLPPGAEHVVTTLDIMKHAEKIKKEPVEDSPGNGAGSKNRVKEAVG